ncbi:hypothetical protein [Streptosporangium brasiliense]|uniref:Uncharacterized protein n=1 Tax=Streptosporangium brasiliense TaxID=47480 RepID=A0ABT9RKY9_9ACTN|nr:hypothetical protein [Streptosporangium brasiliense]MDP9869738.1 hypothetical protein [Streptosporangium brasiliense]
MPIFVSAMFGTFWVMAVYPVGLCGGAIIAGVEDDKDVAITDRNNPLCGKTSQSLLNATIAKNGT